MSVCLCLSLSLSLSLPDKRATRSACHPVPPAPLQAGRLIGDRQPVAPLDPGARPRTPRPKIGVLDDNFVNEPRWCGCGTSFFLFSANPNGSVNRTAYETCGLCHLEKKRRGKSGRAGGTVPGYSPAISEGVSGLLSPLSPSSPIKLFVPMVHLLAAGLPTALREDPSSLRHPRVSVIYELIDGDGRPWNRPVEVDDVVADLGAQVCVMSLGQFGALGLRRAALTRLGRPIHAANGTPMDAVGYSHCRLTSRTASGNIVMACHRLYIINGIDQTCLRATP